MTTPNHGARSHAKMSPSTASQWTVCDAWLSLTSGLPDTPSGPAAREGTSAHEWAELALRETRPDLADCVGLTIDAKAGRPPLTKEMADNIGVYLDAVYAAVALGGPGAELHVETRVSLSAYFGSADGDGTADAVVYRPADKHLDIFDLKYGAGVMVDAEGNKQALQYALGGLERFRERGVNSVTIWIVQPRAYGDRVKSWPVDRFALHAWSMEMAEAVERNRAIVGTSAQADSCVTGSHCRWCKANYWNKCPALKAEVQRVAGSGFEAVKAPLISADDLGDRLRQVPALRAYLNALEDRADAEARAGKMPTGWKWISSFGRRAWADEASAASAASAITSDPYTRELKSPSQLEKEIGKKTFADKLADFVTKGESYKLVPVEHEKPAVTPKFDAASGF